MVDVHSKSVRARNMSAIRSRDTKPEKLLRSAMHKRGLRFRLHVAKLPGRPDMVLAKYNAVVFVNGCFWHGHDCGAFTWPTTRPQFWRNKITVNRNRDQKVRASLSASGWRCLTVWECTMRRAGAKGAEEMAERIHQWLRTHATVSELPRSTR
jgi:DNA mismatch endonuclease, patch repair protein